MDNSESDTVKDLFNDLSSKYDLFNDLFSFGLHRFWKSQLIGFLKPSIGENWIDLCCGTGDLTLCLARNIRPGGKVFGIDSASEALSLACKRASKEPWLSIEWINDDLFEVKKNLNFFDGAVMAYGLRNLSDPLDGLKAIRRFLKPGGRAGILDFNRILEPSVRGWFQNAYLTNLVIPIASIFGFEEHFIYLKESLRSFPDGKSQEDLAIKAGFSMAKHYQISFGQMGILLLRN